MKRKGKNEWFRKEFSSIHYKIKNQDKLSYEDFLRIRNYKLQNSSTESVEQIELITKEAFKLAENGDIKSAIKKLDELEGVAIPVASAILAMKYPDQLAIIDRRVIEELEQGEKFKDYIKNIDVYLEYLKILKSKAKELGLSLRECEMGLFEQNQKKK